MHRAILEAWLPWLGCLLASVVLLRLLLRAGDGRLDLRKLRRLHRCDAGSVQSLSFVLTMPLFIMLVMFIVQVGELMVGIAGVHYAAYAAARAAIVWIPAEVPDSGEYANMVSRDTMGDRPDPKAVPPDPGAWRFELRDNSTGQFTQTCRKYGAISAAATLACIAISPSRSYFAGDDEVSEANQSVSRVLVSLAPALRKYPNFERVIRRKYNYAAANTRIDVRGIDRNMIRGPTYNPFPGRYEPIPGVDRTQYIPWNALEVGWEDPLTVTVNHYFALLPGPGRFLATRLFAADGTPDRVSPVVVSPGDHPQFGFVNNNNKYRKLLKAVPLSASVTLSNEGLKSVLPYVHRPY